MQFLEPMGAWALLALAAVLAFYLLKRQYEERTVPSTYLWRMALRDESASRPLERLRRSLLLILQLLAAALFALALMRPALPGHTAGEFVIVLDASASMQAADETGRTRMEEARQRAEELVRGLNALDRVTVLRAGTNVDVLTSRADRQTAIAAIRAAQSGSGGARMEEALSLARAMAQEIEGLGICVFSDASIAPVEGASLYAVGAAAENRALVSLAVEETASGGRAVARVANYGAACEIQLEGYADGVLCDVRTAQAGAGETVSVSFDVPPGAQRVEARLANGGALALDDARWWRRAEDARRTVVLAGEGNLFLEAALALRADIDVVRASVEEAPAIEGAQLYIFDGVLPQTLPQSGSLLCVNPPEGADILGISVAGAQTPQGAVHAGDRFSENLSLAGVALRTYRPLSGGEVILLCGDDAIAAWAESGAQRAAVIGFDLSDSNLPVKYDFPVLMLQLLDALAPDASMGVADAVVGEAVPVTASARAEAVSVITPAGESVSLAPPFPAAPFTGADEVGEYALVETLPEGEERAWFAVYMPAAESDVRAVAEDAAQAGGGAVRAAGREMTMWAVLLLLAALMLEWWVSRREN
ncbi:MAG TPA: VWA domain-containing protein [Candidatus Ornithocaccomicrobium faecavium]|uniref:VWA domain-containing protein n=1 Tax=Candidatus Ornithocaccomicrobium faecavium TaxID=2840890 RepID=A0A9D1P795_9FIRM|nr:VWA domain-containing protein [Candidatus Ornithocaccomicrobium faecavium]